MNVHNELLFYDVIVMEAIQVSQQCFKPQDTYLPSKGRLISVRNFGVFKSPKKSTKFYQDFYPIKLGQKPW